MPETYSPEAREGIKERVIAGLSEGTPLAVICRELEVGRRTIYDWREEDADFAAHIARAREAGFDALAEEALDIADNVAEDFTHDPDKGLVYNGEAVQRSKLRVETRLKLLAKWDPKRYGDRQLIGSDPENPLPTGFQVRLVRGDEPEAS